MLQRRFDQDVSVEAAASEIGMSPRNLLRRFKAATGHLPGEYLQLLRVAAASGTAGAGAPRCRRWPRRSDTTCRSSAGSSRHTA